MGSWSFQSDPISAGAGLVGSLISGWQQRKAQEQANKANLQIMRENNAAQLSAMRENNQFQAEQAIKMFNLENEYNSPYNALIRARKAGLNPYAGNSAGQSLVQGAQGDASTPTGTAPPQFHSAEMQPLPSILGSVFQNFQAIASGLKMMKEAKEAGVNTKFVELAMDERLKGLALENEGKDITNKLNRVALNVQEKFAEPKAQAELSNILESTQKLVSDILLNNSNMSVNDNLKYLYERQSDLIYSSKLLTDKQKEYLEKELNNYDVRFALESALTKAQTFNQNSQGKQALSGVDLNESLRYLYDQKGRQELYNAFIKAETWTYEADIVKKQFGITEQQAQQFEEMIQKAKNENSAFMFDKAMDFLKSISPIAGAAVAGSIVKGVPLTKIKPQTIVTSTPAGTGALLGIP